MYCSGCGKQLREFAVFCSACGLRVVVFQQPNLTQPLAKRNPSKAMVWVCVFALLVFFLILANVFTHTDSAASPSEASSQSAAPPKEDVLTAKEHLAQLRKLVSKHPLEEGDIASLRSHMLQLQRASDRSGARTAEMG
jgi:hypothetical protein